MCYKGCGTRRMSCKVSGGVFEDCLKSCKKTALKRPCLEMVVFVSSTLHCLTNKPLKRQTSKKGKTYVRDLKWKLYPFVLSMKLLTLVLAVNCWGMYVGLPHWSWMIEKPPQHTLKSENSTKRNAWLSTMSAEETKKGMDTRASSWFQRLARITSPQV